MKECGGYSLCDLVSEMGSNWENRWDQVASMDQLPITRLDKE